MTVPSPPRSRRRWTVPALALLGALTVVLAGCTPGSENTASRPATDGPVRTDIAALGPITLTVWDQEVRGGQNAQLEQLNAAFSQRYPNVTIERVSRSFDDLATTLRLAISGNDAPDIVQANNGRADMGAFVAAGQLRPLGPWAQAYGWADRYPPAIALYSRYSQDGRTFGEGELYGLPQVGELVGIYVNTAEADRLGIALPRTWDEFTAALATAKAAGAVPLQLGNLEGWPGLHVLGTVQDQLVDAELTATGNLPVVDTAAQTPPPGLSSDVFAALAAVSDGGQILPYLDYATPTMADTAGAALQDLLAGTSTPEQFAAAVEADYAAFTAGG